MTTLYCVFMEGRSGSTVLRELVNQHPAVIQLGELFLEDRD